MNSQDYEVATTNWLRAHDPHLALAQTPLTLGAMMDTLPGGAVVAAVPSAAMVGGNAVNYAAADAAIKEAGSDVPKLTKILRDNPIVGCTTVMDLALKHSQYKPLDPERAGNFSAYLNYLNSIVTAPFFHLDYADTKTLSQKSKDWDTLINSIAALFDDATSQDQHRITEGLKNLAHAATSTSDKVEKLNVFSQALISQSTPEIVVSIYYSSVAMTEHKGKHTTRQSDFTVNRSVLNFRLNEWPIVAGKVAEQQITRVDDWLAGNNSA